MVSLKRAEKNRTQESSFESNSLSYESFNGLFNIRSNDLNKIFYSEIRNKTASISSIVDASKNQIWAFLCTN